MPGLKAKMSQAGANENNSHHTSKLLWSIGALLYIQHKTLWFVARCLFLLLDTVLVFTLFDQAVHIKMNVCLVCPVEFALDKWWGSGIGCFSLEDTDNGCTFKHKKPVYTLQSHCFCFVGLVVWKNCNSNIFQQVWIKNFKDCWSWYRNKVIRFWM